MNCNCAPQQPCPNCGYCPCCGRGRYGFVPYQPYYPPYPQPVYIGDPPYWFGATGGYVSPTTTGMPAPLPSITVTC